MFVSVCDYVCDYACVYVCVCVGVYVGVCDYVWMSMRSLHDNNKYGGCVNRVAVILHALSVSPAYYPHRASSFYKLSLLGLLLYISFHHSFIDE